MRIPLLVYPPAVVASLVPPGTLAPGAVFHGRYRVLRALKTGGMGAVYEVVDANTASPRALKVMLPSILEDADQRARFSLEARVTGNIDSDHVVRVSDSGIDEASGSPFLVMELLRGEELGELLKRQKTLPPGDVVTYLSQAALALDKTHAASVVHRDLKPDNLFLTQRDDGSPCVKILDFGIAKIVAQNHATKTRALGTPLFMAPEQIKGESGIGPRSDLYALAHVAYTLLAGEAYFREESTSDETLYALLMKIMAGADEPPSVRALRRAGVTLPPGFDAWFFKATAVSPDARFDHASAQVAALAEVLTAPSRALPGASAQAAPPAVAPPVSAPSTLSTPQRAPLAAHPASASMPIAPSHTAQVPSVTAQSPVLAGGALATVPAAAPAKPAIPKAALFALIGVGAVMAVGLVLIGVSKVGDAANCAPGATCTSIDVPDPTHVDVQALLPAVEKIARSTDSHAALAIMIIGDVTRDGTSDISGEHSATYQFTVPAGTSITIAVRKRTAVVIRSSALPVAAATPPRCSQKAAWKAAVAAGLPAGTSATMTFSNVPSLGGSIWTIAAGMRSWLIDGQTCAHKKP